MTWQIPDSFSPREISILSSVLDVMHCSSYAFVRTWIAIALEYGYYNCKSGRYDTTPRRVLFLDSGASHTTLFVVHFSKVRFFPFFHHRIPFTSTVSSASMAFQVAKLMSICSTCSHKTIPFLSTSIRRNTFDSWKPLRKRNASCVWKASTR